MVASLESMVIQAVHHSLLHRPENIIILANNKVVGKGKIKLRISQRHTGRLTFWRVN